MARACVCRRRSKLYTPAARFGLLAHATHGHELFQVCTYRNPQKISGDKWHVVNIFFHKYFLEKKYILVSRISHDLWCQLSSGDKKCIVIVFPNFADSFRRTTTTERLHWLGKKNRNSGKKIAMIQFTYLKHIQRMHWYTNKTPTTKISSSAHLSKKQVDWNSWHRSLNETSHRCRMLIQWILWGNGGSFQRNSWGEILQNPSPSQQMVPGRFCPSNI